MNQKLENNDTPLGKGNKCTSFSLEPVSPTADNTRNHFRSRNNFD